MVEPADTEDKNPICRLAALDIAGWRGLPPFPIDQAPECLGPERSRGWLEFRRGWLAYRDSRPKDETAVRLFAGEDGNACLLEVYPSGIDAEHLLAQLRPAETIAPFPLEAELQYPVRRPGETLEDHIYGARGLALLLASRAGEGTRVVRLRGFEPMTAAQYRQWFVDLPPLVFET